MKLINADALIAYCDERGIPINVNAINAQPTIEESKTGKWKFEDKYVNRYDETIEIRRCSNCGFKHYYCQGNTALTDDAWFNFCPHCGSYNGGNNDA